MLTVLLAINDHAEQPVRISAVKAATSSLPDGDDKVYLLELLVLSCFTAASAGAALQLIHR